MPSAGTANSQGTAWKLASQAAAFDHHGLAERIGRAVPDDRAGHLIAAEPAGPGEQAAAGEQDAGDQRRLPADRRGAIGHRALGLEGQPGRPVHDQHGERHQPAIERQRIEQAEQIALIDRPQIVGEMERHALQRIADRHAEDQRRHGAADEQRPVPVAPPGRALALGAVFEADRPQDEREQHQEHGEVEAGEAQRIERRPGGEDRAAAEDEPDLVAFPDRADGVDHHAPFPVGLADEGQQRADPHVEAVGDREADEQHAKQDPPDQAQRGVGEECLDHDFVSLPVRAVIRRAPCGRNDPAPGPRTRRSRRSRPAPC